MERRTARQLCVFLGLCSVVQGDMQVGRLLRRVAQGWGRDGCASVCPMGLSGAHPCGMPAWGGGRGCSHQPLSRPHRGLAGMFGGCPRVSGGYQTTRPETIASFPRCLLTVPGWTLRSEQSWTRGPRQNLKAPETEAEALAGVGGQRRQFGSLPGLAKDPASWLIGVQLASLSRYPTSTSSSKWQVYRSGFAVPAGGTPKA